MIKSFMKVLLPAVVGLSLASSVAAQTQPLDLKVFSAEENGFYVSSVLVTGETDAVLFDTQFSRSNALRVAALALDSGKELKTIYISQGDPDYYFGIEVLKQEFPDVKVYASADTVEHINATLPKKLETWGPRLGANGPRNPIIPEVYTADSIELEGEQLELVNFNNPEAGMPYVWIPSLKAVVGGVSSYSDDLHVWTADAATKAARAAWVKSLDAMLAREPEVVVPGHQTAGSKLDSSSLVYTRDYLLYFEQALDKSSNSAELIDIMKKAYPDAGLGIALEIGAKVNTGEMTW
ncbi:MBL fold metallo-hydrolase [Nitrincola sp. MINF-07-Sa-05]|uniref:MBL fold metallo-hydrolase n=1 Tax=Nitrincola salilacus TaxID=3400273 RepID=UPI003917CB55